MRGLLDGSEAISESTLKELKNHWEYDVKRLNFAMDKLNREHFYRPIEVSFLILLCNDLVFSFIAISHYYSMPHQPQLPKLFQKQGWMHGY